MESGPEVINYRYRISMTDIRTIILPILLTADLHLW